MAKPLIQRNICSQLVTGLTGFHFWIVFIIRTISLYQGSLDSSDIIVAAVSKTRKLTRQINSGFYLLNHSLSYVVYTCCVQDKSNMITSCLDVTGKTVY